MTILVRSLNDRTGLTVDGQVAVRKTIDLDRTCKSCGFTIYAVQREWVVGDDYYHDKPECITILVKM